MHSFLFLSSQKDVLFSFGNKFPAGRALGLIYESNTNPFRPLKQCIMLVTAKVCEPATNFQFRKICLFGHPSSQPNSLFRLTLPLLLGAPSPSDGC